MARVTRVKLVPNLTPNDNGRWVDLPADSNVQYEPWMSWNEVTQACSEHVPPLHHIVSYETDRSYANA